MPYPNLEIGIDGLARCGWVGTDPIYLKYHDQEWGQGLTGDRDLFEKVSLEGFQAGLSWITILRRRENFRQAFAHFDFNTVAEFTPNDVERLMADEGIIRNRAKIESTISNARVVAQMVEQSAGAFSDLMWSFQPAKKSSRFTHLEQIPTQTPESVAMSKELKKRGMRFVGPTTMYALMQSAGMVDDHLAGCHKASR